jgi:hypothetical protein
MTTTNHHSHKDTKEGKEKEMRNTYNDTTKNPYVEIYLGRSRTFRL